MMKSFSISESAYQMALAQSASSLRTVTSQIIYAVRQLHKQVVNSGTFEVGNYPAERDLSIRISPRDNDLVADLAAILGCNQRTAIEEAVRRIA